MLQRVTRHTTSRAAMGVFAGAHRVDPARPLWLLAALLAACSLSCGTSASPDATPSQRNTCAPSCEGRVCGSDGCGGSCGACASDTSCLAGACVPSACEGSCESLGYACGSACGVTCGDCPGGQQCEGHQCVCAPQCSAATCGQPDGCGGTCGPCARSESCESCALRLHVAHVDAHVTVALHFTPPAGAPLPVLADLRFLLAGGHLVRAGLARSLMDADKQLLGDPETGLPFRRLSDGTWQVVIASGSGAEALGAGTWLALQVAPEGRGPVVVALAPRAEQLAPVEADAALYGQTLDGAVVVWVEEGANAPR